MSSSANQPVCVGSKPLVELAAHDHEREPGRREEVLDRPRRQQVDAEGADVERDRARRLVAVREAQGAVVVRETGDLGDVEPGARAVGDGRAADERRSLVDRFREPLDRNPPVGLGKDVDDLGAAELLRVRDLADGRELELRDHDPPTLRLERQRAHERAHALRDRRRHRDLRRIGLDESREGGSRCLGPLDPVLPLGAVLVPAREVLLVRRPNVVGERALRARVRIHGVLEDREALADGRAGSHRPR